MASILNRVAQFGACPSQSAVAALCSHLSVGKPTVISILMQRFTATVAVESALPRRTMSTDNKKSIDISGIYPPIATPFDGDQDIDYAKLTSNIERWHQVPFRGLVVMGSNGESAFLSREERVELVRNVRRLTPSSKLIIAGSGCESSRETIEMSNKMADAGADAVLVVTPCYYKASMTNEALYRHFIQVADASRVPVILYSVPANTGIDLAAEVVIRLSSHPNIIGLKDSAGDVTKLASMVYKTKDNHFQILAGSAGFLYPSLTVGCVGAISALANVLGSEVCELYKLFNEGRHEEAKSLQHRIVAPNTAVTRRFGVPGLKYAMDWFGLQGGRTRDPLLPLTDEEAVLLKRSFTDCGFLP